MQNNEKVVMAAVQQYGRSLQYGSKDMKNNEKVVMAAVQQDGRSLEYASEDMKNRVVSIRNEWDCTVVEAVQAMTWTGSKVIQVSASKPSSGYAEQEMVVTCIDMGGNEVAALSLDPNSGSKDLCKKI